MTCTIIDNVIKLKPDSDIEIDIIKQKDESGNEKKICKFGGKCSNDKCDYLHIKQENLELIKEYLYSNKINPNQFIPSILLKKEKIKISDIHVSPIISDKKPKNSSFNKSDFISDLIIIFSELNDPKFFKIIMRNVASNIQDIYAEEPDSEIVKASERIRENLDHFV